MVTVKGLGWSRIRMNIQKFGFYCIVFEFFEQVDIALKFG